MVRHILTTALFSFAVLALSASQLRADADGRNSTYSATECKVDVDASQHPDPSGTWMHIGQAAPAGSMVGGAQYNTMYNRGGSTAPPNLKGITNTARSTDAWYSSAAENLAIVVNCPLPVLDFTDMYPDSVPDSVVVTIVDGTAQGNVTCRLRACDGGIGVGGAGTTGQCVDSHSPGLASNSANWRDDYSPIVPPGDANDHVSPDVDFLTFGYMTTRGPNSIASFGAAVTAMLGTSNSLSHRGLNPIEYSLVCSIPEQDVNQETAGINTFGYSYIQSYAVNPYNPYNP